MEEARAQDRTQPATPFALTAALQALSAPSGARLPQRWDTPALSQPQRTALRRCLSAPVAWPRVAPAQAPVRLVWRGGEPPPLLVPVTVKRRAALPKTAEMAQLLCDLLAAGQSDAAIATP